MKIEFEVPEYDRQRGLQLVWDEDYELAVDLAEAHVRIRGNAAGLRSLARHLLSLAQEGVPGGRHLHLDEQNALDQGSTELILERR